MINPDIIVSIRRIRQLVMTLDSIGYSFSDLEQCEEISNLVPKKLHEKVVKVSSDLHIMLQNIEKSRTYKEAVNKYLKKE